MAITVIILAAGHGKRMNSTLPKVLHTLAGKTLLAHVVEKACLVTAEPPIVVYGYQGEKVQQSLKGTQVVWVEQSERLGTGHAVMQALPFVADQNQVLILYGDVPLISVSMLMKFISETPRHSLGIITANFPDPTGIGRILRNPQYQITAVIEEKDASDQQKEIKEVNSGFYLAPIECLRDWLPRVTNQNAQGEYYLTDIIALAIQDNVAVHAMLLPDYREALGINNVAHLEEAGSYYKVLE
jgi:bifunctional UDP-N-acetylglucosamine pyrophosphorylase/glucosamine-1-phosphate N-acetyltransferase